FKLSITSSSSHIMSSGGLNKRCHPDAFLNSLSLNLNSSSNSISSLSNSNSISLSNSNLLPNSNSLSNSNLLPNSISSLSNLISSSNSISSLSNSNSFDSEQIKRLLKYEKQKYQVIKNESASAALWWRAFGYPAQMNSDKELERIVGFISCFKCMNTQVYNKFSGTKRFKEHADKCFPLSSTTSSSNSFTSSSSSTSTTQATLNKMGFIKHVDFTENDITKVKDLSVKWVCGDIRPFSILDDSGFRNLAQECVRLGAVYGIFDVNEVLRGEKSISRHVMLFADNAREQIKELLSIPLKEHSLTICPDYWTDSYKKISYLGVSVIIVDDEYRYKSIDLCCTVRTDDLTHTFHAESTTTTASYNSNENHESSDTDSESSTDDEYDNTVSLPVIRKKKSVLRKTPMAKIEVSISQAKIAVDQIPPQANHVLQILNKCKKIVKYTGINNDIKVEGGVTLHQSCIVRWLSMSNLLESLLKSLKATKRLLITKKKQSLINDLDETTIKQLVLLLKPFKHVMTLIQTGNAPSLHMVLLCVLTLKDALTSYKALVDYKKIYCNSTKKTTIDDELEEEEDDDDDELEGIKWFRERLLKLIDELFVLDVRHYCSTMLHPKYRLLKNCTKEERSQCHKYVREQLKIMRSTPSTTDTYKQTADPPSKKFKTADTLFARFEDDCSRDTSDGKAESNEYESDEYELNIKQSDELDRYLVMQIDKSSVTNNPLDFWKTVSEKFPLLSKLAKRIHSIPATSTGVERQFSSAGLIINQRRTNINPEQVDNILLIRSLQKL
ncbi:unnamed protein product, partial [Rotaria sp. Silwood2]